MGKKIVYVDGPPSMEIKKGLVHIRFDGVAEFVMSPFSFSTGVDEAVRLLNDWDRSRGVVPMREGK